MGEGKTGEIKAKASMAVSKEIWDGFLPFVSQWYWQESNIYPYKKSKVSYHGPRMEWMNLVKDEHTRTKKKKQGADR